MSLRTPAGLGRAPRLLLVSPRFHEYWRSIGLAIAARGYEVRALRYDEPTSLPGRLRNSLLHRVDEGAALDRLSSELTDSLIRVVREWRPDIVLTIKGDLLADHWWDAIDASGARHVTWLYDEVRTMRHSWSRLERMPAIVTYSPNDAAEFARRGLNHRFSPVAFDHRMRVTPVNVDEVTFVGARYPNREALLRTIHDAGVPVRGIGRDWSRRPADVLMSKQWRSAGIPWTPNVPRSEAFGYMAGAPATLNIHGDQAGCFTMRTFEAPGVGALQLIDRPEVEQFYEPGREVLVYTSAQEAAELAQRVIADPSWARGIRAAGQRRTLAAHTFDHRVPVMEELWA